MTLGSANIITILLQENLHSPGRKHSPLKLPPFRLGPPAKKMVSEGAEKHSSFILRIGERSPISEYKISGAQPKHNRSTRSINIFGAQKNTHHYTRELVRANVLSPKLMGPTGPNSLLLKILEHPSVVNAVWGIK